jgi:V/A-type H+-transporting ATPase subunit D
MTRRLRAPATRLSLLRTAARLRQVQRGTALLKRKRQSLVDELFARARAAMTSRETIENRSLRAWQSLWAALSSVGSDGLAPLGWPMREVELDVNMMDVWGVRAPEVLNRPTLVRSLAARGVAPGPGEAATHEAACQFELLLEQVLDAAPREYVLRRLGRELARTTRLVNTLERRIAVTLEGDLAAIRRTLAEREREEQLRVKRLIARRSA